MAQETKISWTDATFNPWRGCVKVSPGCAHCYAEGWAKRTGKKIWGADADREHAAEVYWKQPVKWNAFAAANGNPFRVFCASLADVCEDREDLIEPRARLMRLIEATPALTWQLCTKRPENFMRLFGRRWGQQWPRNVWAMTTAENQEQADLRIPHLIKVPAVVRGVSYEPALGPVDFRRSLTRPMESAEGTFMHVGVDWVIVGGESGAGARQFNLAWAQDVVNQCRAAGVAAFVKQLGARPWWDGLSVQYCGAPESFDLGKRMMPIEFNGKVGWRVQLDDPKGGDSAEWPEDLRVQQFPKER